MLSRLYATAYKGRLFVITMLAVLLLPLLTACGSSNEDPPLPAGYGPRIAGNPSCAYVVSPDECEDSGIDPTYWYQMPTTQPQNYREDDTSDVLSQLFLWHMVYSTFYSSPMYYNTYVPPAARNTYVTQYVEPFNSKYGSRLDSYHKQATYVTADGKKIDGSKVSPKQFATAKNNGGDRKRSRCSAAGVPGASPEAFSIPVLSMLMKPPSGSSGGSNRAPAAKPAAPKPAAPAPKAPAPAPKPAPSKAPASSSKPTSKAPASEPAAPSVKPSSAAPKPSAPSTKPSTPPQATPSKGTGGGATPNSTLRPRGASLSGC